MHNCYSNHAYMHGYYSMCICYFINFRSHLFFSLFSVHNQRTQFSSPHLLFPQMHTNKHTHTHTQTHPHTNKPTRTNQQRDRSELLGLDRCLIKARGSWSVLDWSSSWLVLVEQSELVDLLLERSLTEMGLAWSELRRSEREGDLICVGIEMGREMGLAGDHCLFGDWVLFKEWSYLWKFDWV